jgi:hypothetical protein
MFKRTTDPAHGSAAESGTSISLAADDPRNNPARNSPQARQSRRHRRWPRPSASLVRHAEAIRRLDVTVLAHLLAELQGAEPGERVRAYAELEPLAEFIALNAHRTGGTA